MKRALGILFSLILVFALSITVFAQSDNANIPERNGDYPVPGHPELRVHVFVHEPGKPTSSTSSALCTDPSSTTVDKLASWHLPNSTWDYKVNSSSVPSSVGSSSFISVANSGFTTWTTAITSSSKPTLHNAGNTTTTEAALDGANIIAFGATSDRALGITYIWYNIATKEVVEVDTILNNNVPWTLGCTTGLYDANDILIHEQGHWFGLDDNYAPRYVNNTMYGYGTTQEIKKITPAQGDIVGINRIY